METLIDCKTGGYKLGRKPGRAKTSSLRQFSISMPPEDSKLIRKLVGNSSLSGFGWRACIVMAHLLYDDDQATARAAEVLREPLTDEQLVSVIERLHILAEALSETVTE